MIQQNNGTTYLNSETGRALHLRIANNTKMIIASDGKVGIGTTTPTHQLDVNGSLKLQSIPGNVSQGYEAIRFARNDNDIRYSSIYASAYHVSFNVHDNGPSPHTGEIEVMRLTTDRLTSPSTKGRVGIGTTDPIYTLDVSGEISSSEHLVKNGTYTVKHHRSDGTYPNLFERTTYDAETVLSNKDTFIPLKVAPKQKLLSLNKKVIQIANSDLPKVIENIISEQKNKISNIQRGYDLPDTKDRILMKRPDNQTLLKKTKTNVEDRYKELSNERNEMKRPDKPPEFEDTVPDNYDNTNDLYDKIMDMRNNDDSSVKFVEEEKTILY